MVLRFALGIALVTWTLSTSTALGADGRAPLQIVVSKERQALVVYDGDTVVATSNVSSGKRGHDTPTGIFSILEKSRHHRSNIYSNAPMPFMQRLTWSGIALHGSNSVPAYPASHGCVRLPNAFAKSLFGMTKRGLHVIVSERQVAPRPVSHPLLFQPVPPAPQLLSDAELRPSVSQMPAAGVEVAMSEPAPAARAKAVVDDRSPIRILVTRRGQRELNVDVQAALNALGYDAGPLDGAHGAQTRAAIRAFETASSMEQKGEITPELVAALFAKADRPLPQNGRILVRRDFTPLFEAPVTIDDPAMALGVHFFQFQDLDAATGKGQWFGMSLDNALAKAMKSRLGITGDQDPMAYNASARTLDRIRIATDVRTRIKALLTTGSSLTVSDLGLGQETGKGTDFVTVTQTSKR